MSRTTAPVLSLAAPLATLVATLVATPVVSTASAAPTRPPVGQYFCTLRAGETVYPAQPCRIYRSPAGALLFEKTGGSQRFSGPILIQPARPDGAPQGFRFQGLFFCPLGDCDEFVAADFAATNAGSWIGTFTFKATEAVEVTVSRARPRPLPRPGLPPPAPAGGAQ